MKRCCNNCIYNMTDDSVGYSECTKVNDFTDAEWEYYEDNGKLKDCPYFEEDRRMLIEPEDIHMDEAKDKDITFKAGEYISDKRRKSKRN